VTPAQPDLATVFRPAGLNAAGYNKSVPKQELGKRINRILVFTAFLLSLDRVENSDLSTYDHLQRRNSY
jgi:hypothetical protein